MGRVDPLRGLKENVAIGHLIPAGTGLAGVPEDPDPGHRPDSTRKRGSRSARERPGRGDRLKSA